jgi:hypothetical protein
MWLDLFDELATESKYRKNRNTSRISVIIISHNRPRLLKKALQSVKSQTLKPFEVIVIDDASADFESFKNVEVILTEDNSVILEKSSNSKLIISQHSGSVYLGEYTNSQVLIIYKGGNVIGDIEITDRFKKGLGMKFDFNYAFDLQQIEDYLINFKQRI